MTTVYAKTEFYNGTTLKATVDHTNAASIPTLTLDGDVDDVKYQGDVVTSVVFTPLDPGLTAERHVLQVVGTCATTQQYTIPGYGDPSNDDEYNCSSTGTGWSLQVRTKPKVKP